MKTYFWISRPNLSRGVQYLQWSWSGKYQLFIVFVWIKRTFILLLWCNLLFWLRVNYDNFDTGLVYFQDEIFQLVSWWPGVEWVPVQQTNISVMIELKLFAVILCQVEAFMSYDMQDIVMSRYVTSCHGVWWDLGFENVKHGLISYNGNQGRGIFHASYLSPVAVRFSRWVNSLYD